MCNANGDGLPCLTDRNEAERNMAKYLTISWGWDGANRRLLAESALYDAFYASKKFKRAKKKYDEGKGLEAYHELRDCVKRVKEISGWYTRPDLPPFKDIFTEKEAKKLFDELLSIKEGITTFESVPETPKEEYSREVVTRNRPISRRPDTPEDMVWVHSIPISEVN
jgi:hypothetical protein|tara:strand:- start:1067 stop:1567 length:501 start_codon:yes stop_codon:yes gene_type:complete